MWVAELEPVLIVTSETLAQPGPACGYPTGLVGRRLDIPPLLCIEYQLYEECNIC